MSLKQCMHLVLATVILLRCLVWSGAFGYVPPPGEMLGSSTSGGAPADAPKREDGGRVSRASGRRSTVAHVYSVLASYCLYRISLWFCFYRSRLQRSRCGNTSRHERKPITHTRRREITEIRSRTAPADAPADTPADALHLHVVPLLVMAVLLRWAC